MPPNFGGNSFIVSLCARRFSPISPKPISPNLEGLEEGGQIDVIYTDFEKKHSIRSLTNV